MLKTFTVDDPIVDPHDDYVEVTITFTDDRRRWCFFITPAYIAGAIGGFHPTLKQHNHQGLTITSTFYLGETLATKQGLPFGITYAPHMIIVSELSDDVIAAALLHLDEQGNLENAP